MRSVAILLCLCMLLSLCSCISVNRSAEETTSSPEANRLTQEATSKEQEAEEPSSAVIMHTPHYKIERSDGGKLRYEIYDLAGKTVHSDETDLPLDIFMVGDHVVDIRFGKEPSYVRQFYDLKSHRLSEKYSNLLTYTEELAIYLEKSVDGTVLIAKNLFDNDFCREYALDDLASTPNPIRSVEFTHGKLYLTYDARGDATRHALFSLFESDYDYFTDYASVVRLARELCSALRHCEEQTDYRAVFGIPNGQAAQWFDELFASLSEFYPSRIQPLQSIDYAVRDLNGDGDLELILLRSDYTVVAIFSTVNGKPFLLDRYWERKKAYIDHRGWIYVCGSNGADQSSRRICRVAEDGASLEPIAEFGLDGTEWIDGVAVQKYYKTENNQRLSITEEEYHAIARQYSYPSVALTQNCARLRSVFLHDPSVALQACAREAFLAVLRDQREVYHVTADAFLFLKDYSSPHTAGALSLADNLSYALVDMDGDCVTELVIDCGETLILRYHEGTVCLYAFASEEMLDLMRNGIFRRVSDGQDTEQGLYLLCFDGKKVQAQTVWRIVNDGKPNAEYYINTEQVTKEALLRFQKKVPHAEAVEYSPLKFPFEIKITSEQAREIANAHWHHADGKTDAACGTRFTSRVVLWREPYDGLGYYHIVLLCEYRTASDEWEGVSDVYHVSIDAHLLVDAVTGEKKSYAEYSGK